MDCNGDNSSSLTVEPQSQRFQNDAVSAVDEDLKLVGAPLVAGAPDSLSSCRVGSGENRKRGRVPRGVVVKATTMPVKRQREEEEEEDVCFICFDGGSLVLCDRKGCPKAYHPACIKRDEAFFRAAAKWTCGWHICSVCQKASHYMCYTCTYSVCKGCTKTADYFCVRGNKGFCSTCMRIIKLIENIDQGNKEMVQVDFDDKSSWEYLFKVYWMYLKEKLSLTLSELIQAKKPWKESDAVHAKRQRLPFGHRVVLDGKGVVGKSFDHLEQKKPKQLLEPPYKDHPGTENRTTAKPENLSVSSCTPQMELTQPIELELRSKDSLKTEEASISIGTSLNGSMEWASKELLELVAHMRNGDTSALSHFDVQTLLLDYIKRNNLRDPRRKSQIICDSRLKSLFGKPCVGHIEMLKLLEFHFLIKEDSQKSAFIPAGIIGTVTGPVETDDNNDISFLKTKTKKHKSRRSSEEKLVQTNLDEYAAIDAHNINLIYLRRDLMESLIEDMEKFHSKVIGSVVRIRICKKDQKQELYRLVHVIGTSKAFAPYKIRQKTANVLLEVLNLNKKETVPIDSISNQDFSEDECRRLRQIIKCGLVKRLTVGEIQKKAMELRAVKLNDSLEAEILRLNHLRDRASEKGHKKELRECVEKLELLKMPEERQRRLRTIPEVHVDPKMDPSYESDEDARESDEKKQEYVGPRYSRFSRREEQLTALCRKVKEGSITAQCKIIEKRAAHGNNMLKKIGSQSTACQAAVRPASETSTASLSAVNSISANNSETEKLWHYRDPSGRIQGPFSVMQLRKWNKSGLFPPDMRIWTNDEHVDSVLLTNALIGLFHKVHRVHREISPPSQELGDGSVNSSFGCCGSATGKGRECGEREVSWRLHITKNPSNGNTKITRMDGLSSSPPQCFDLNNTGKPKSSSPVPLSSQGDMYATPPRGKRCHEVVDFHSSTGHVVQGSSGSTVSQISNDSNHSMQSNSQSHLGQSSGQSWGSLTSNKSLVNMDSRSSIASVTKSSDSFEHKRIKDFPELPSPTPKTSCDDDIEAQVAEELLSLSSGVAVCASDIPDLPSPTPKLKGEDPDAQAAEKCESFPANVPVQDAGPSSSSASSLVIGGAQDPTPKLKGENLDGQAAANKESFPASVSVQDSGPSESKVSSLVIGGAQFPEIAKEWAGHSPGENPSMDSAVISGSSLKQAEAVGDHVDTPTSDANQLNQTSPSNPVSNFSGWEPIEFTTLDEDSVSDLLAEVDAMESQTRCGLGSPTSAMWCSDEMISASISDCFSSIEELSPMPDRAKNDALSSSDDIQLSCQSFLLGELAGASQTEGFDPSNRSSVNSSPSNEGETKSADASFPCVDAGPNIPAPCTTNQNTAVSVISLSTGAEALTIGYQAAPGNVNAGGPVDGYTNVGHGISMVTAQGNSNVSAPFTGNPV